jgi:hypothetical protein
MGGSTHFLAYKSLKTLFFTQKYFTRYTQETFFKFKIFHYLSHCGVTVLYTCSKFQKSYMPPATRIRAKRSQAMEGGKCMIRLRALKSAGFWWNLSRSVQRQRCSQKKQENGPDWESATPSRDRKLIEILTGATLDCGPQPGQTSAVLGWSVTAVKNRVERGGRQGGARTDFWQKNVKMNIKTFFWRLYQRFEKIRKTFLQE